MNTTDQIAAEAADNIVSIANCAPSLIGAIRRQVKTAIEKAYDTGWHEGVRQCANKQRIESESRAAHASEQGAAWRMIKDPNDETPTAWGIEKNGKPFIRQLTERQASAIICAYIASTATPDTVSEQGAWTKWRDLIQDGRPRALCWNCGYPELIGSDDCRNCSTNFDSRRITLSQRPTPATVSEPKLVGFAGEEFGGSDTTQSSGQDEQSLVEKPSSGGHGTSPSKSSKPDSDSVVKVAESCIRYYRTLAVGEVYQLGDEELLGRGDNGMIVYIRPIPSGGGEGAEWKQKIADFVLGILHGDEVHQQWLREAGEAFVTDKPLPPPRSAKDKCFACAVCGKTARELKQGYLQRANRTGIMPPIWICTEHLNEFLSQRPTPDTVSEPQSCGDLARMEYAKAEAMSKPDSDSVGEKWTKKQWPHGGDSWDVMCGQKRIVADLTELECDMIINAHNATMQPRDCGADTKRLDWLEDWLEKVKWDDYATVREAIDAAMSETRRGEKSQP